MLRIAILFGLVFAGGCARYEYDIVEPSDLAQHIGAKSSVEFTREAIRYSARSSSDRLVLFIHNDADEPLKLLGEDSYVIDPHGESHPLPTRTIGPHSTTKLIIPPIRPTFRRSGPSIGLGVGVGLSSSRYGRRGYSRGFAGDPYFYDNSPRYYALQDDGTTYWDWNGNGTEASLRLVYELEEQRFSHDFTFRRVKV